MEIKELLKSVERNNASDLHITPNTPPIIRVNGSLIKVGEKPLSADETKRLLYSIITDEQKIELEKNLEIDFSISIEHNKRFRVNIYHTHGGLAAVLRDIPTKIPTLHEIFAPQIFYNLTELPKGLILVTGATGEGKSTTQAAMLDFMNETTTRKIITIEDPIEFVYQNKKSLITQREVGTHTNSFANALRSSLREDPDVIFIGELRDLKTAEMALMAAETGHLVISTLHTASASEAVDRIINMFPLGNRDIIRQMLASSIEAIISQKLLIRKDERGRVAAFELLMGTTAVRNVITEGKTVQLESLLQTGSRFGMQSMKDAIKRLFEEGIIDEKTMKKALASSKDAVKLSDNSSPIEDAGGASDF